MVKTKVIKINKKVIRLPIKIAERIKMIEKEYKNKILKKQDKILKEYYNKKC